MEWIYGRNVVKLALAAGARRRAHRLAATAPALKLVAGARPGGSAGRQSARTELDELTGKPRPSGRGAAGRRLPYADADEILRADIIVVLDEVSDPRNLGAVARSAAGGRRRRPGRAQAPLGLASRRLPSRPRPARSSILPVAQVTNVVAFLQRRQGRRASGSTAPPASAAPTFWQLDLTGRVVLVFGAEGRGLRPLVARTCDALAAIPMDAARGEPQRERRRGALPLRGRRQRERGRRRRPRGRCVSAHAATSSTATTCCTRSSPARARRRSSRAATGSPTAWRASPRSGRQRRAGLRRARRRRARAAGRSRVRRSRSCFAGGRFTADTLIARRIAEQPADVRVVVVSADQEVQRTATRAGVQPHDPARTGRSSSRRRREALDSARRLKYNALTA